MNQVQILEEAVYISLHDNILWKGIDLSVLPLATGK